MDGKRLGEFTVRTVKIKSIRKIGRRKVYDVTTKKNHNFVLGNGILTHNTQEANAVLRRVLEDYADIGRVIFSLNYLNKMSEAVISRCQVVEFAPLSTTLCVKLFSKILDKEQVTFDPDELFNLAEDCRGDLRKAVGTLQRDSTEGQFTYGGAVVSDVNIDLLLELAKTQNWQKLYDAVLSIKDIQQVYRTLFDKFWSTSKDKVIAIIGEYSYRNAVVLDKQLNLLVCFREILKYNA